jgi:hypothetical protein
MIFKCEKCADFRSPGAEYQNKTYGPGMRVHNRAADSGQAASYRCTICEQERGSGSTASKKIKIPIAVKGR